MLRLIRRVMGYLSAAGNQKFDERADPKVQLEQAILEANEQHRRLKDQAGNVIANQKQTELRLNRAIEQLEKANNSAAQALMMADTAQRAGDSRKASEYSGAAESFANRMLALEQEVEELKQLHLQSSDAAAQAKAAVQQNAQLLQDRLAERQKLLSQLDQAKMQEQVNQAMSGLGETVGGDVPTLEEVRAKIEARYAKAKGMAELNADTVDSRMAEVEAATRNQAAQARLQEIRQQLGLPGPADA